MVSLRIRVFCEWFGMIRQNFMKYTPGTASHLKNLNPKTELLGEFEINTLYKEHSPAALWKPKN
jgi:hypothetical protein